MNGHSSEPPPPLPLSIAPLCVVLSSCVCVLLPAGVRSQRRRRALEAAGVLKGMQPVDQSGQDWQAWSNTRVGQLPNRRLRAGCLPSRQAHRVRRCYQCVCVLWHMHGTSWRSMGGSPLAGDKRQHNLLGEATSGDQNSRSCSQEKEVSAHCAHCRGDQSQCSQLLKPILIIWWNTDTGVAGGSCRNLQFHRPPVEPWCVLVGGLATLLMTA